MSRPKLAPVQVAPTPKPRLRYTIRPEAMYPDNPALQAAYASAIAWMRRGPVSIFTLDQGARRPAWCAPPEDA